MDRRNLYKAGCEQILDSSVKNKRKLKVNAERSMKRKDLYSVGRDLRDISQNNATKDNENVKPAINSEMKISQQKCKEQLYLAKFHAWKANKEACLKQEKKNKLQPFFTAVSSSFAPTDFKFKPPTGLKYPTNLNKNVVCEKNKPTTVTNSKQHQKIETEIKIFRKPLTPLKNFKVVAPKVKSKKVTNAVAHPPTRHIPLKNERKNICARNMDAPKIKVAGRPRKIMLPKISHKICTPSKIDIEISRELDNPLGGIQSNFLTSTGRKSTQNPNLLCEEVFGDTISPIDVNETIEVLSSGKEENMLKTARKSLIAPPPPEVVNIITDKILPPEEAISASSFATKEHQQIIQCEKISSTSPNLTVSRHEEIIDLNSTPAIHEGTDQINYMSPFVTISRGKVSARAEREKRESTYKLETSSPDLCSIPIRRARESAKYFRTVLNDEVNRLRQRCELWEEYKLENGNKIEENGIDMINATIGQTRLLTSKKLEQFRGLIDRCVQCSLSSDSKGSQQAILPEDLEGFWSMVQLQIENIDKRFENLDLWKANNWYDPDDKPKPKKNLLSKVIKGKNTQPRVIKPNERLKDLLKKAQTAYKKGKANNSTQDCDIIFMTSKRRSSKGNRRSNSNTPVRRSSRQLESKSNSDRRRSSNGKRKSLICGNNSPKSTPRRSIVNVRRSLLVSTLNKAHEKSTRKSQSPKTVPRKSILKTPGTKKHHKKVLFNEQLNFKSPDSIGKENMMSGIEVLSDDDNELQRSLHLRSRRVLLRPDSDIEIPR